jgi:hypothetical protein
MPASMIASIQGCRTILKSLLWSSRRTSCEKASILLWAPSLSQQPPLCCRLWHSTGTTAQRPAATALLCHHTREPLHFDHILRPFFLLVQMGHTGAAALASLCCQVACCLESLQPRLLVSPSFLPTYLPGQPSSVSSSCVQPRTLPLSIGTACDIDNYSKWARSSADAPCPWQESSGVLSHGAPAAHLSAGKCKSLT